MDRAAAYAPGSTSNVGPGFDCLGIAIAGLGDRVVAEWREGPGVRVVRVSDARVPVDPDRNTAALAVRSVLRRAGSEARGVELAVEKGLPLSGGLGGSAASAVAGAFAANALLGGPLDEASLLECALEAEAVVAGRHPDNAAPSLLGGAVLVLSTEPLRYARLAVHPAIRLVFATPDYGVETARARAVLPDAVSRLAAVGQAAALGGLVLGLERGDEALLRASLVDRVAEPSRIPLYPGYVEAREAALGAGAHGLVVSGAGPTVLALAPEGTEGRVGEAIRAAYAGRGVIACLRVAEVDRQGARPA
jgi:homoserine kinase